MKRLNLILLILILAAATVWASESTWSSKLATLTATDMDPDDMWLILIDPNSGTPASGLIGRTEALADWPGSTGITTLGTIGTGTWQGTAIDHERGGLEADVSAYDGFVKISGGTTSAVTPNVGTDITADLEEETHAAEHAVSAADTVFPADPGADRVLMWDDDPGTLIWYDISGDGFGDMLKATYDVSGDGFVDGNDVPYAAAWNGDVNAPSMNAVYDEMETKGDIAGQVWTGVHDFGGATSLEIPNDESADATLTTLGQVHIRGDEDRLSAHLGAGGEIAGEATISFVKSIFVTFDPGSVYDSNSIVPLPKVSSKQYPNGIIIDAWEVNCHLNPDVEMDFNLGYSVNPMDMADPNLIDVLDTTNGQSSEDTDASINGGAAVPVNTYIMLYFDADPEGTCTVLSLQIWYHGEED